MNCKTVQEMFAVLDANFDLKNCSPGMITKPIFVKGILKGIDLVKPTKK